MNLNPSFMLCSIRYAIGSARSEQPDRGPSLGALRIL